jgi:hypothetical protein
LADDSNTGFFRNDALLGVIVLTDEDDCSTRSNSPALDWRCEDIADDVNVYLSALDTFKGSRDLWGMKVIAGESDCESELGSAHAADRLYNFADQAGDNVSTSEICDNDLEAAYTEAIAQFGALCDADRSQPTRL